MKKNHRGLLHVLEHPLAEIHLARLRDESSPSDVFRATLATLSALLFMDMTRGLPTRSVVVKTPLARCAGAALRRPVVLIAVLRAGLGMLDGMRPLLPQAHAGHVGLYRDEKTLEPCSYYAKVPPVIGQAEVFVLDPMLATGGSASAALAEIKRLGARSLRLACIVACRQGIARVQRDHPEVPVHTVTVDARLNQRGYIVPGLGDAGDRQFGT